MPPNPAGNAASDPEAKKKAARETIDILHEISTLLVSRMSNQLLLFEKDLTTIYNRTPISTANPLAIASH
jgi:hypothetical protein